MPTKTGNRNKYYSTNRTKSLYVYFIFAYKGLPYQKTHITTLGESM